MPNQELIKKYVWVKEIGAWTVAIIEGLSVAEVVHVYGGDPTASVGDYAFAQLADLQGHPLDMKFHVQAFEVGRHVVAWEDNGWSGSHPEIARRCSSDGGRFFSVFWNINAVGYLTAAVDGKITAQFESLYPLDPNPTQPGEVRPDWATGDPVDVAAAWPACFALLEQQTGCAVDPTWRGERRPTFRIREPHELYRGVESAGNP